MSAAVAAIQFALEDEDGIDFLSYWNQGDFDIIRRNWPEAPETVYIGADPLHPATAAEMAREQDGARLAKLLAFCTEAKPQFGTRSELRAMTMKFKTSVETSIGYRKELRKLIDEMQPTPKGGA
jgi:hypothetical protein